MKVEDVFKRRHFKRTAETGKGVRSRRSENVSVGGPKQKSPILISKVSQILFIVKHKWTDIISLTYMKVPTRSRHPSSPPSKVNRCMSTYLSTSLSTAQSKSYSAVYSAVMVKSVYAVPTAFHTKINEPILIKLPTYAISLIYLFFYGKFKIDRIKL